ncbi:hypothetical protein EI94DRAFT_1695831 [Lactarius quietus]|nr:hypothetical protein EI94DRAFT_1695831 [Lactarius quietus]
MITIEIPRPITKTAAWKHEHDFMNTMTRWNNYPTADNQMLNKLYNAQHPLLMTPLMSNLDTLSGLLTGTSLQALFVLTLVKLQACLWFGLVLLQRSWSDVPTLFLRCRPLMTLGRSLLPQLWSHSGAVRLEKRKVGQGGSGKPVVRQILAMGGHSRCMLSHHLWAGVHGAMLLPPLLSPFDNLRPLPPAATMGLQWGELHSEAFGTGAHIAGPLPPTTTTELQWGEPRSEAFGTGVRIAGSAVNPDLTPLGSQVGEEESRVGWKWKVCCCRHLQARVCLTTLGHPTLTTIVDSQWGELHSEAFGTKGRGMWDYKPMPPAGLML